jgi:deoxyribodipyrimidine photolyase-related protein
MAILILGNQLFHPKYLQSFPSKKVFMAEDEGLATRDRHHKLKIAYFFIAMRDHAATLRKAGFSVDYHSAEDKDFSVDFETKLLDFLKREKVKEIFSFEVEDKFFEHRLNSLFKRHNIAWKPTDSPMFLSTRKDFSNYLTSVKKPFMKNFYERQRKRLDILIDRNGKPVGGKWSLDEENRKRLPLSHIVPEPRFPRPSPNAKGVIALINQKFSDHPGDLTNFWPPTNHAAASALLDDFLQNRFQHFGEFEDTLSSESVFVYHSTLTPALNIGLLTPKEVIDRALSHYQSNAKSIGLNSVEGFIRQIIGWREFVRGIYQNFSQQEEKSNFFGHKRKLTKHWYDATLGIPPADDVIRKANQWGYTHHIERLMVMSNLMLLSGLHPKSVHAWFMEMHIDSSDWVMGPNVYGMGQFSDGGIFATKPYICGSNYILKMSHYERGPWCDTMDGLYWSFIDQNRNFFARNPRLNMMLKTFDRFSAEKKKLLARAAEKFISTYTS